MKDIEIDLGGLEAYQSDRDLESKDGIWAEFPGGREILVLRAGGSNHKFGRVFQKLTRPYQRQLRRGNLDPEISNQIMRDAYLEAVIIDWRGWTTEDGDEIPYSKGAMFAVLAKAPAILEALIDVASDAANFSEEDLESVKK